MIPATHAATRSPPPCRVPVRTVDRVQAMSRTDAVEHLRERTPESWAGRSPDRLDRPLGQSDEVLVSFFGREDASFTLMRLSPGFRSEGSYRRQRARVRRHIGVSRETPARPVDESLRMSRRTPAEQPSSRTGLWRPRLTASDAEPLRRPLVDPLAPRYQRASEMTRFIRRRGPWSRRDRRGLCPDISLSRRAHVACGAPTGFPPLDIGVAPRSAARLLTAPCSAPSAR